MAAVNGLLSMDDAAFHKQMKDLYERQNPEPRPAHITEEAWKNRYLVQSKLSAGLYSDFYLFCKGRDLSISTGIKFLISTHPLIKSNG